MDVDSNKSISHKAIEILLNYSDRKYLLPEERGLLQLLFRLNVDERKEILIAADRKCRTAHQNRLYIRGVIELSNICSNRCKYCSMSVGNKNLKRYIIPLEEIIEIILQWYYAGIRVFHLSSGEQDGYSIENITEILKVINNLGARAILVFGGKTNEALRQMINVCPRITLIEKFETSNPWLYEEYNNKNRSLEMRIMQLSMARKLGYKIGTGNIVGLPYQSFSTLIDDLILLKKISPEQASTSNYVSVEGAEYSYIGEKKNVIENTKLFIALMRLILNDSTIIPTNSSMGIRGKEEALHCGANLVSLNLTPEKYLINYLIYGKQTRIKANMDKVLSLADSNGLQTVFDF